VSVVVDVLLAAGGVAIGRWLAQRLRAARPGEPGPSNAGAPAPRDVLAGAPCRLGDVLVRTTERDEAWLAGALVFREQRPVAALFVAPEAVADRAVFAREGDAGVTWLTALGEGELSVQGEPPHALEHAGVRFERVRRLPVRVEQAGTGAPNVGDRAVVAEYAGPGAERIVVVSGSEQARAWVGRALRREDFDVLPGSTNRGD